MANNKNTKDPFETTTSTEARAGQTTLAPSIPYAGFWSTANTLLDEGTSLTDKYLKGQDQANERTLSDYWAKQDEIVRNEFQEMEPTMRSTLEKEAAARNQLPGNYMYSMRASQATENLMAQGFSPSQISEARAKFYGTQPTLTVVKDLNDSYEEQRKIQENMNSKIVDAMITDKLDVRNQDGTVNRDATLRAAYQYQQANANLEEGTNGYNAIGIDLNLYRAADNLQKDSYNNKMVQYFSKNLLDAKVRPMITQLERVSQPGSYDINKINQIKQEIAFAVPMLRNTVGSWEAPDSVKTSLYSMIDDWTTLIGGKDITNYDQTKSLEAAIKYQELGLEAAALGSDSELGSYRRAMAAYGGNPPDSIIKYLDGVYQLKVYKDTKLPSFITTKIDVLDSFTTGSAPRGYTPAERVNKYSATNNITVDMISKGATKTYNDKLAVDNGLSSISKQWIQAYQERKGVEFGRAMADAVDNWNNPSFADYVGNGLDKNSKSFGVLTSGAKGLIIDYITVNTGNFLKGNNSTLDLINYDSKNSQFIPGTQRDLVSIKDTGILAKALKDFGNAFTTLDVDSNIRDLNRAFNALVNAEAAAQNINLSSKDKERMAKEVIEYLKSQGSGDIRIISAE